MKNHKPTFILLLILITVSVKVDSRLKISSTNATMQPSEDKKSIQICYTGNVESHFENDGKAHCNELEVVIDKSLITGASRSKESNKLPTDDCIKKVTLTGNVRLCHKNRKLSSEIAQVYLKEKVCKLFGNIKFEQVKENKLDIPITTEGKEAIIKLDSYDVELFGSNLEPACTTITVTGYPKLMKKKKTRKEKRLERKSSRSHT